ncbi:MAG: GntR family transcriptional regulator [Angelakisella sp.]
MSNKLPKYAQIIEYFTEKIKRKELAEGEKIPTEEDLCRLFNVSRITVRQALDEMVRQGDIIKIQGKGSYVGTKKANLQLNNLQGFSEEMRSKGLTPSTQLVEIKMITPPEDVAQKLMLGNLTKVYSMVRVRYADDIAMAVEHAYIPFYLCTNLEQQELTGSMYTVLEKIYNIRIVRAKQNLEAIRIDKNSAQLLSVKPGTPALQVERVSYLADGTVCEFVKSVYRGDKYKFYVDLERK